MSEEPRSLANIPPREGFLIGLLFAGIGLYIVLLALNVLPGPEANAPPAIAALAGVIFMIPGVLAIYHAVRNVRRGGNSEKQDPDSGIPGYIASALIMSGFAAIGLWISLAGSNEGFSGGIAGSAIEFRIVFGIGSVISAAAAALFWSQAFKRIRRKKNMGPPAP